MDAPNLSSLVDLSHHLRQYVAHVGFAATGYKRLVSASSVQARLLPWQQALAADRSCPATR